MATPIKVDPGFEALRKKFYQQDNVLFNILDGIKFRETALIRQPTEDLPTSTIRCIKANALRFLAMNFERFRFLRYPFNMYSSVAQFPNMPMMSFNRDQRRRDMDAFNAHYVDYITAYDFLIDIDNTDLTIAYAQAYKCKRIFDTAKVPYTLTFSGNKGFHIRIAYEDFPDWLRQMPPKDLIFALKRFVENFRTVNALYSIDLSIFDLRRIAKVPYSIVYPYYFIALPLSDEQMDNFTLKICSMPYWLTSENIKKLYKRGLLKRPGTPEAFGEMVKRYSDL